LWEIVELAMGWFTKEKLAMEAVVFEQTEKGPILEINFKGDHHHMSRDKLYGFVEQAVEKNNPVALILNFLEYRYSGGDEMGGVFINAGLYASRRITGRPFAVIAKGYTSNSLKSLFRFFSVANKLEFKCDFFESVEAGADFLRKVLTQANSPSPS
jgi:hypothetical protein